MGARKSLRRIADPVVAAPPAGARIRARIHVTEAEAAALTALGEFLGSVYRGELAGRTRCGVLDRPARAEWRAERKRAITADSSSRWAGTITRAVEDQYQLGMRALTAYVADLRVAVQVLEQRCSLRPGQLASIDAKDATGQRQSRRVRGYRSAHERFAKTRRLAVLRSRLAKAQLALAAGHPSVVVGGKSSWRNRSQLEAAEINEQQWRKRWDASRMFITADGESGVIGGNLTIRVNQLGRLELKMPAALVAQFGERLVIETPVSFAHRSQEWAARVAERQAVRYDVSYDSERGRWYVDASWTTSHEQAPPLDALRRGRVVGVDLNADHLACCVLDSCGNPVGDPTNIDLPFDGLRASRRDGRLRAAIAQLLDHARHHGCAAIVVERLDFGTARATGRETLGRGQRGKRFRRVVAGIPTRRFRDRLLSMASRCGIAVIEVDPAYTSKWGAQHWVKPLQQQASDPDAVTRHHGAAVGIGRRGLGLAIRRRPAGPRNGQRTAVGTPPARPTQHGGHGRHGSSRSPTCTRRGASVHGKARASGGQHRSGRTGLGPAR